MPFLEVTGNPHVAFAISANHFPRFLFSDVTGHSLGLRQFADALKTASNNIGQIYVWEDDSTSDIGNNLDSYATHIADELIQKQPRGPVFMGGYSWGCSLGRVVAHKLTERGRLVAFYGIDSPSIKDSQTYLQAHNPAATQDLIAIFGYVTELSMIHSGRALTPLQPIQENELGSLISQPLDTQIIYIRGRFLENIHDENMRTHFIQFSNVVIQNLHSLLRYPAASNLLPLLKIGLFFSDESRNKYHFDLEANWVSSTPPMSHHFPGTNHRSLLSHKPHCTIVANHMADFFGIYFSPQEILSSIDYPQDKETDTDMDVRDDSSYSLSSPPLSSRSLESKIPQLRIAPMSALSASTPPSSSSRCISLNNDSSMSSMGGFREPRKRNPITIRTTLDHLEMPEITPPRPETPELSGYGSDFSEASSRTPSKEPLPFISSRPPIPIRSRTSTSLPRPTSLARSAPTDKSYIDHMTLPPLSKPRKTLSPAPSSNYSDGSSALFSAKPPRVTRSQARLMNDALKGPLTPRGRGSAS